MDSTLLWFGSGHLTHSVRNNVCRFHLSIYFLGRYNSHTHTGVMMNKFITYKYRERRLAKDIIVVSAPTMMMMMMMIIGETHKSTGESLLKETTRLLLHQHLMLNRCWPWPSKQTMRAHNGCNEIYLASILILPAVPYWHSCLNPWTKILLKSSRTLLVHVCLCLSNKKSSNK